MEGNLISFQLAIAFALVAVLSLIMIYGPKARTFRDDKREAKRLNAHANQHQPKRSNYYHGR